MVIDNRPGAGTIVGTDLVAKATPDGYTLLVVPSSFTIGWTGMLAPARTPSMIIKSLNDEKNALLKMPAARERFQADGSEPGGISPEEFAARIRT